MDHGGEECHDLVLSVFQILDYLVHSNQGEYIQSRLNLCTPVDVQSKRDIGALFQSTLQTILDYFTVNQ